MPAPYPARGPRRRRAAAGLACLSVACAAPWSVAQEAVDGTPSGAGHSWFSRGDKGFEVGSPGGRFHANLDLRAQLRYTGSYVEISGPGGRSARNEDEAEVNRARIKVGGHIGRECFDDYWEHDLVDGNLLDLRGTVECRESLQLRFGQWKIPYNRERIDSSGNQQFADRSIATKFFTLDRQRGAAVFGRLFAGTRADSWYNLGLFEPLGREGGGDYADPLWLGRWQWNFLGRDLGFSQGDLGFRDKPAASLALAAAHYRGPYTAFSSDGGGSLPGFERGDRDRYEVGQWMLETAWQYGGYSWQQEWHRKRVDDTGAGRVTTLEGGYAQAGAFPHALWPAVPKPLELALRYAQVDPDTARGDDVQTESIVVLNWFLDGHRNKLTVDHGWLTDELAAPGRRSERRWRLQWDVSL
jgi:hypothetical protein